MNDPLWDEMFYAVSSAMVNCMVDALDHCYESADAAGMDWTQDGWLSVSASNICGMLKANGVKPPAIELVERRSTSEVYKKWAPDYSCENCYDTGYVEAQVIPCRECKERQ